VASFTADDLIVTGGSAFEVIPVQHTNDYFVWLAVHPGAGSFSVVIKSGACSPPSFTKCPPCTAGLVVLEVGPFKSGHGWRGRGSDTEHRAHG
jgi:hypothetical protein